MADIQAFLKVLRNISIYSEGRNINPYAGKLSEMPFVERVPKNLSKDLQLQNSAFKKARLPKSLRPI
jgi:hypothetical protein